jgi:hypothetical protein
LTTTDGVSGDRSDEDEGSVELEQNDGYVIQMPQNFRFALLKSISENNIDAYCDLPIFCTDGVVYSNKFLLSAASSFIK